MVVHDFYLLDNSENVDEIPISKSEECLPLTCAEASLYDALGLCQIRPSRARKGKNESSLAGIGEILVDEGSCSWGVTAEYIHCL